MTNKLSVAEMDHLTTFILSAEMWLQRSDQLELTPLEFRFNVDLRATIGAAKSYISGDTYSDVQLFRATMMSATFCGRCVEHDSKFYDHYFNYINEFLPKYSEAMRVEGVTKLTLAIRDDGIAEHARES